MYDHERVYRYVERRFQKSGCTEFPTVREVARALRMKHKEVLDAVDGTPDGNLMMTSFLVFGETPIGDHYIETM